MKKPIFLLVIIVMNLYSYTYGQNSSDKEQNSSKEQGWEFTLAPYIMIPWVSGDIIINGNDENINSTPGDLLKSFELGGMLYFEAANPKWSVSADFIFAKVGNDFTLPLTQRKGKIEATTNFAGIYGMYRVVDWFEIGLGGRFNIVDSSLKVEPGRILPAIDDNASDTWFDPLITYRFTVPIANEKWYAGLRGDIGGFGVGSDFAWMVFPAGGYRFSHLFELSLGFRAMGLDFKNDDRSHEVKLNFYGPQIGFLFHF